MAPSTAVPPRREFIPPKASSSNWEALRKVIAPSQSEVKKVSASPKPQPKKKEKGKGDTSEGKSGKDKKGLLLKRKRSESASGGGSVGGKGKGKGQVGLKNSDGIGYTSEAEEDEEDVTQALKKVKLEKTADEDEKPIDPFRSKKPHKNSTAAAAAVGKQNGITSEESNTLTVAEKVLRRLSKDTGATSTTSNSKSTSKSKSSSAGRDSASGVKGSEKDRKKKRKMSSTEGDDSDDMGDDEQTVKDSLRRFAEDNDISPEDLALAYGGVGSALGRTKPAAAAVGNGKEGGGKEGEQVKKKKKPVGSGEILEHELSESQKTSLGKYLAIDCEMVATHGRFPNDPINEISALARVSIVNYHGHPILDTYVLPTAPVTDWRTHVSGIRPSDMAHAIPFALAQAQVSALLKNRILVGHAVKNDLDVLMLSHPKRDIRDTSKHERFRTEFAKGRNPGLKVLAKELLGVEVQQGEHSSVEDARVTMAIYRRYKREFEEEWARRFPGAVRGTVGGPARSVRVSEVLAADAGGEEADGEDGEGAEGADGEGTKKKKKSKPKNKKKKKTKKR